MDQKVNILSIFSSLQKEFEGEISFKKEDLLKAGQDFGKVIFSHPIAVLKPYSNNDISLAVKFALQNNFKIISKGASHSAFGQSQCNAGIIIDMSVMNNIIEFDYNVQTPWIDVQAGAHWDKIVKFIAKDNFSFPTTTDWLKLSIGGTFSTGGVGFMSYCYGLITDNIIELDVINGEGKLLTCSNIQNKDLFDAVRAGLGQYGIIVRAKLKLTLMPTTMMVYQLFFTDTESFEKAIKKITASKYFECVHSFVVPNTKLNIMEKLTSANNNNDNYISKLLQQNKQWLYFVELVKYDEQDISLSDKELASINPFEKQYFKSDEKYYDYITKEPPLIKLEKKQGKNPHPEIVVIQPAETFTEFMNDALQNLTVEDMGEGPILIIPIISDNISTPMFKHPKSKLCYFVGFLRSAFPGTKEQVDILCQQNIVLYKKAILLGGYRYPADSLSEPSTPHTWKMHYGQEIWNEASATKTKHDPQNIFVSNLNIFGKH